MDGCVKDNSHSQLNQFTGHDTDRPAHQHTVRVAGVSVTISAKVF
jgi:hypothetical protein